MIARRTYAIDDLIHDMDCRAFSFTRWGDGEFSCIFGARGRNIDGQRYTPELQRALIDALTTKGPTLGLQPFAERIYGGKLYAYVRDVAPWAEWVDADILHREERDAAKEKRRTKLLDWLASTSREIVFVGPAPVHEIADKLGAWLIEVPARNAFARVDDIIKACRFPGAVYLWSAGMAANVCIHRLHGLSDATHIDVGSIWTPYLSPGHGLVLRGYQRDLAPLPIDWL